MPVGARDGVRVPVERLKAFGRAAFAQAGLAQDGAAIVTDVQVESETRGNQTHGVRGIPGYAQRVRAGGINRNPHIRVVNESPAHAVVDGDHGPGQWVSVVAMQVCLEKARANGLAAVTAFNSNHYGASGYYASMALEHDLIGLCTTCGGLVLAPTGGITPVFGNDPLGVAIPADKEPPILLDIAMSVVAQGKVSLTIAEGKPIPQGWITDRRGRPTTDPSDWQQGLGLGLPIGGHKGYGLVMVMEVLAGVLSGARYSRMFADRETWQGPDKTWDIGHFFLAVDPSRFLPLDDFKARMDQLIRWAHESALAEGAKRILTPGQLEWERRADYLRHGVLLPASTYAALTRFIEEWQLDVRLD